MGFIEEQHCPWTANACRVFFSEEMCAVLARSVCQHFVQPDVFHIRNLNVVILIENLMPCTQRTVETNYLGLRQASVQTHPFTLAVVWVIDIQPFSLSPYLRTYSQNWHPKFLAILTVFGLSFWFFFSTPHFHLQVAMLNTICSSPPSACAEPSFWRCAEKKRVTERERETALTHETLSVSFLCRFQGGTWNTYPRDPESVPVYHIYSLSLSLSFFLSVSFFLSLSLSPSFFDRNVFRVPWICLSDAARNRHRNDMDRVSWVNVSLVTPCYFQGCVSCRFDMHCVSVRVWRFTKNCRYW